MFLIAITISSIALWIVCLIMNNFFDTYIPSDWFEQGSKALLIAERIENAIPFVQYAAGIGSVAWLAVDLIVIVCAIGS